MKRPDTSSFSSSERGVRVHHEQTHHQNVACRKQGTAKVFITVVVAVAVALSIRRAEANNFANASFIQPTDLAAFQNFGGPVAADGNTMAISSLRSPFGVYIYTNNNGVWTQQAKLTSPTGSLTDRFGASLAIQGNTLVVGAASGAYVFMNFGGSWTEQTLLVPTGGSGVSFAGGVLNGMCLSGNTLAVGAPSEATAVGNTGSVYAFTTTNGVWTQQARVTPTDPSVSGFGTSIAVQNDTLLVGAPFTGSSTVFEPGAAFVFTRQNGFWTQQTKLDPPDPTPGGLHGENVSLDGNTAVIGAPNPSEVDIFLNNNGVWSLQALISGPEDSDFGTSVKIIGDLLMVTAYDDVASTGVFSGDAFIFTRGGSTWTEQPSLYLAPGVNGIPGPGQFNQRFGNFSAMTKDGSRTIFVIGSQTYSNPDARSAGAVYTATLN
jgi:hypothetical protein